MTNARFRVPSLLAASLQSHGVSLSRVLAMAGLPAGFFAQERILVTTAELFALWRAVAETSGDPALGLKIGSELSVEHYDPAAIAALCSRSFADALERLSRYKQLSCPEELRVSPSGAEVAVEFAFLLGEHEEPTFLVDICLSWVLAIGRRGTDHRIVPLRLETSRSGPAGVLEEHFGCPVVYGSAQNRLILRRSDLERPFVTQNAELLGMLAPQLDAELNARQDRQSVSGQVKQAIKALLAGRRPRLQEVAQHLGLTPRTLQRRLTETGATFQHVVEEARRELAHHYLSRSRLELNETAYLLGYDDASSFFRAFQQWEGTSPNQWRQRQLATV